MSSDLEVTCPGCGKKFMVPDSYAGKTDSCSACSSSIKIPANRPSTAPTASQMMAAVVTTPYGKFRSWLAKEPAALHMVCMASMERLRVPIIAPTLAPVLGMLPAEVGPILNHSDRIVVECPKERVMVVVQFFTDKGYPAFAIPSAAAPAPAIMRSVVPCGWGPDGLSFQMNARGAVETVPWKSVKAIGVAAMVREVTTIFGPVKEDMQRGSRIMAALNNVGDDDNANANSPEPTMVHLLIENEKLPPGQVECLECNERNLTYEFLGADKAMGSAQNFALFVRGLLERAPHAFAPENVQKVAAGERRNRVVQNRRSMIMFRRWLLACEVARDKT